MKKYQRNHIADLEMCSDASDDNWQLICYNDSGCGGITPREVASLVEAGYEVCLEKNSNSQRLFLPIMKNSVPSVAEIELLINGKPALEYWIETSMNKQDEIDHLKHRLRRLAEIEKENEELCYLLHCNKPRNKI